MRTFVLMFHAARPQLRIRHNTAAVSRLQAVRAQLPD